MRTSVGPRTDTALPDRYSSRMRFVTADGRAPCRGAVNRTSPPQDGVSRLRGGPPAELAASMRGMMFAAAQRPELKAVFGLFSTNTPQIYLDIDREKAQTLGVQLSDVFMAGTPDLPSAALRGVVTNNSPELLRAIELEISVSDCSGYPLPGEQPCHVVGQVRRRTEDVNVPAGQARTFQIFPLGFGPLPVTEKTASAMSRRFGYRITSIYSDRPVSQ